MVLILVLLFCFNSLPAYAEVAYIYGRFEATEEYRGYILSIDGDTQTLTKVPLIDGAGAYEITDMKNGKVLFKTTPDDWFYGVFSDTRVIDLEKKTYKSLPLDKYNGNIKILNNGYYARKRPMGAYEIFEPNTLEQLHLDFDYGPRIAANKIWPYFSEYQLQKYDELFDERFDYHKYVGLQLTYSPYNNMYIMIYGLSPMNTVEYYSERSYMDETLVRTILSYDDTIKELFVALFDDSGRLIKQIPIPSSYNFDMQLSSFDAPFGYQGLETFGWQCNLSIALSEHKNSQILVDGLLSNGNTRINTILVDLDSGETTIPTQDYVKVNFEHVRMRKNDSNELYSPAKDGSDNARICNASSPIAIEEKNSNTYIVTTDDHSVLYVLKGSYELQCEKFDLDGSYYALLMHRFPSTEEYDNPPY